MATQAVLPEVTDLPATCAEWLRAKQRVVEAQAELDRLSAILSDNLQTKVEGSETKHVSVYTVSLNARINRRLDKVQFDLLRDKVDPAQLPIKETFDESKWKQLKRQHPEVANVFSSAVIETAGKPGVEVTI